MHLCQGTLMCRRYTSLIMWRDVLANVIFKINTMRHYMPKHWHLSVFVCMIWSLTCFCLPPRCCHRAEYCLSTVRWLVTQEGTPVWLSTLAGSSKKSTIWGFMVSKPPFVWGWKNFNIKLAVAFNQPLISLSTSAVQRTAVQSQFCCWQIEHLFNIFQQHTRSGMSYKYWNNIWKRLWLIRAWWWITVTGLRLVSIMQRAVCNGTSVFTQR